MNRSQAGRYTKEMLDKHGLKNWSVRVTTDPNSPFLGMCSSKDKAIILNAHHIDIHPEAEVIDTILHEVAHAIVGSGQGHNDVWRDKAKEIGCKDLSACSTLNLPDFAIDAIRSGANVEVTIEEETIVTKRPKYTITRLQEKCPDCGKPAKEKFAIDTVDKEGNQVKLITLECFHIIKRIVPKATPFESMVSNFWKPEVASCIHNWDKNTCLNCGEYRLYNFQVVGARFAEVGLATQKGVGIFDDMGLGKTIQALALLRFHSKTYKKTLVVTKSAIKFQWFKAAITWLGPEFIAQIISTSRDYIMPNLKLYIIPYDLLRRMPADKLAKVGFNLVILDEVQQIKNPDSSRTQEVRKILKDQTVKVIELSGTPWKNRGSEYFPALNLLDPIKFYSYQNYLDTWVEYYYVGNKRKMGGIKNIPRFKTYTESLIIRREYEEVMEEFPIINRMKLPVQLDELAQTTYDDEESEFVDWYNQFVIGGEEDKVSGIEILAQMARMRHIVGLAKIPATLTFIEEYVEDTERKLVVFTHHKDVMTLMYRALTNTDKETNPEWYELAVLLKEEGVKVLEYTSRHTGKEIGTQIQDEFNNTPRVIMLASTLACGEGLNLQTCADCVFHERQWNPQNEDQAAPGRFRRIGQTAKKINITVPEAEGSIDEDLDFMVTDKRGRYHKVMNKGEMPVWNEGEFARELANRIIARHKAKNKGGKKTNITSKAKARKQPTELEVA